MCKEYISSILPAALLAPLASASSLLSLMVAVVAPDVFLSQGLDAGSALCRISRLNDNLAFSFARSSRRSSALEACEREAIIARLIG